ncbi:hypothetical protein SETIT_6G080300v2 [Setaria italica]|uniref:Uncharacterized protein n=2 Tax=Setaria TaxID=4554 RepID=A0A368RJF3_SETIT|nr:hypothetical protein SETIT_6G080300v2 [Setaria italica]TKW09232.1 hypothetical protein SEVIR_6G080400v2 [Setaria viridis]
MPKRISPVHQSPNDALYNGFMHVDEGLNEVLRLGNIDWTFTRADPSQVRGGWQADITLSSSMISVRIGETFHMPYKARDSGYIYALYYVDGFLGIDINHSLYVAMINDHDVDDPKYLIYIRFNMYDGFNM